MLSLNNEERNQEQKILIIIRGISGSGKSFLSQTLKGKGVIFSADDFFMIDGEYKFDPKKLGINHQLNQKRTEEAMKNGITPIIIDNTNVSKWEAKPYVSLAQKYGYVVRIEEPNTPWKFDAEELTKRNTHGVPRASIDNMLNRWEKDFDVDSILASKAPWER